MVRNKSAFTLVELLVVIGVIAVLSVLLLPAVEHGITMAKNTYCLNNLRQKGAAMGAYAKDNRGMVFSVIRSGIHKYESYDNRYTGGYTDAGIEYCPNEPTCHQPSPQPHWFKTPQSWPSIPGWFNKPRGMQEWAHCSLKNTYTSETLNRYVRSDTSYIYRGAHLNAANDGSSKDRLIPQGAKLAEMGGLTMNICRYFGAFASGWSLEPRDARIAKGGENIGSYPTWEGNTRLRGQSYSQTHPYGFNVVYFDGAARFDRWLYGHVRHTWDYGFNELSLWDKPRHSICPGVRTSGQEGTWCAKGANGVHCIAYPHQLNENFFDDGNVLSTWEGSGVYGYHWRDLVD